MDWKVTVITYNLAMKPSDPQAVANFLTGHVDAQLVAIGLQEVAHAETIGGALVTWASTIAEWMSKKAGMVLVAKNYQATNQVLVFAKRQLIGQDGVVHRQSPGRPRTTSRAMDRNILRACREDPRRTSTDIQVSVTSPNEPMPSRRTIRRRLQVAGLHGRRPVKKPLGPRKWANHIWSNESKLDLFGTDGIQWIRRPIGSRYAPQYQCPPVKHGGGSVMVWGCFSVTSMGPLKGIVETMDRYVYEDILENTMRPWARANLGRSWVFQQDNDPKHTSGHVANWFRRGRVDLLEWPSQSPDLNPIEHMWEELERRLKGVRASNADQKFAQFEAA
uniref:Tc1-like transposase DDE domain-containing protein n=1 Tax=Caenorhabditis japonica TaxID=281687 RepID=A0A8R1EGQ8_CAEJA